MGVLNVTPDSFSDGGQFSSVERAAVHGQKMALQGASIIDIGGESTRPNADDVAETEELSRVIPVIKALTAKNTSAKISIDTRRPNVAKAAMEAGASIWNDVTALSYDENSARMAAQLDCDVVLMHMQGEPQTMQKAPYYKNAVAEVIAYLKARVSIACKAGVARDKIILDPGIGFGKRLEDNLDLMQYLDDFHILGQKILFGASRKSFINALDTSAADERLGGSIASVLWAASMGASIVRVHDVQETVQALKIWHAIRERE